MPPDIYSYIKTEESKFETEEIQVGQNWSWNFRRHVQMIFHLKNGVFFTGENNWLRAFKNIMEPILNLAYWMEDIEVKDIIFYIENSVGRVLSFLIKKYHDEVYVKENDLDTMIDEITESDIDYGGTLVQDINEPKPEVLALEKVAFCDQSDVLGGVIGFKYSFSPSKLRSMSKAGWGEEKNGADISIEDLIVLVDNEKEPTGLQGKSNQSTSKNIDVYILHGNMPEHYLKDNNNMEDYSYQLQIRAFYTKKDNQKNGVCLYRKEEDEDRLMFHTSKKVSNRALGRGVGETLLHPQIWENFLTIHKMNLMAAGSKIPLWTDDEDFANVNQIQEQDNLEVNKVSKGSQIGRVPTMDANQIQLFANSINEWYEHAQLSGSAFDPVIGKQPVSGTTFRGQERVVQQGRGAHDRRRGQRAKFIEMIYRKIIIPKMVKSVLNGKKFLATLSTDEMTWVSSQLAANYANKQIVEDVLNGQIPRDRATLEQEFQKSFAKKGNKHLIEILKDEFRDVEVKVGINVAGKQKDLAGLSDKLFSIFQFAFQNPQQFQATLQLPGMAKLFTNILEFGGINQIDFSTLVNTPPPQPVLSPMQPMNSKLPVNQ